MNKVDGVPESFAVLARRTVGPKDQTRTGNTRFFRSLHRACECGRRRMLGLSEWPRAAQRGESRWTHTRTEGRLLPQSHQRSMQGRRRGQPAGAAPGLACTHLTSLRTARMASFWRPNGLLEELLRSGSVAKVSLKAEVIRLFYNQNHGFVRA